MGTCSKSPGMGCMRSLLLPSVMFCIFGLGVLVTQSTSIQRLHVRRDELLQAQYAQHVVTTVATMKSICYSFLAQLPAANTGRMVIKSALQQAQLELVSKQNHTSSFHSVLVAFASSFYFRQLTFAVWTVFNESDRPNFEQVLGSQCRQEYNVSRLADVSDPLAGSTEIWRSFAAPVPASPTGLYAVVTHAVSSSGHSSAQSMCNSMGVEISSSSSRMRSFVAALETGRILYQEPRPSLGIPDGNTNIGVLIPLHAATVAEAGSAGSAHAAFVRSRPADLAHVQSTYCGTMACGLSERSLGVISIPLYPAMGLDTLREIVPQSIDCEITMIYVPPPLRSLIPLDLATAVRKPELASALQGTGYLFSEQAYMEVTYTERASATLPAGVLLPILQATEPLNVLLSVEAHRSGSPTPLTGRDAWSSIPRAEALRRAIEAEGRVHESLQAGACIVFGPHVYLFIVRNVRAPSVDIGIAAETARTWLIGCLLSALVALSLPVVKYWYDRRVERQHAQKVKLVQAERDGVVQAVAFAAHEIRNPMHGVLASLETALADLQPFIDVLHKLTNPCPSLPDGSDTSTPQVTADELRLQQSLCRLFGGDCVDATLSALEDVSIARMSAESCHRLVNDMVDYSKLQKGVMRMQSSDMVVRDALRAGLMSQRRLLAISVDTYLRVHKNVPETVWADQVRILQVVSNALTNACKFTFSGSISLNCFILDSKDIPGMCLPHNPSNQWLTFVISDTGKGLAGIDVDSLFEPIKESTQQARKASWQQALSSCRTAVSLVGRQQPHVSSPTYTPETSVQSSKQPVDMNDIEVAVSASAVARSRGSGLGLPVARLMARTHGGDCELYTAQSDMAFTPHTHFLFVLPISAVSPGIAAEPPQYPLFGRSGRLLDGAREEVRTAVARYMAELLAEDAELLHVVEEISDGGTGGTKSRTTGRSRQSSFSGHASERCSPTGRPIRRSSRDRSGDSRKRSMERIAEDSLLSSATTSVTEASSTSILPIAGRNTAVCLTAAMAPGAEAHLRAASTASYEQDAVAVVQDARRSLRVLYAENDATNRRLMHRMVRRAVQGSGNESRLDSTSAGPPKSPTTTTPPGNVELFLASDGWEAMRLLYSHGHVDFDTLCRLRKECSSQEGELSLPSATAQHAEVPFDLILLEIDMPRASGALVAQYLRRAQALARPPSGDLPILERQDGRALTAPASVPVFALTGRSVGFEICETWYQANAVSAASLPSASSTASARNGLEKVHVVPQLTDTALATIFDGVLGKPFKQVELTWLITAVQCLGRQKSPSRSPPAELADGDAPASACYDLDGPRRTGLLT